MLISRIEDHRYDRTIRGSAYMNARSSRRRTYSLFGRVNAHHWSRSSRLYATDCYKNRTPPMPMADIPRGREPKGKAKKKRP